jgi:hypothetical protein
MRAKRLTSIIALCVLPVIIICAVLVVKANRASHKRAIVNDTVTLMQILSDWDKAGQLSAHDVTNFIAKYESPYKSYKPYLFTNVVQVDGTNYHCLFGMRDSWFAENETLAVTDQGVVVLIDRERKQIIYSRP